MVKTYLIPTGFTEVQIEELLDRIPYISECIVGMEYDSMNQVIDLYLQDEKYESYLEDGLKHIEENIRSLRISKQKNLKDNTIEMNKTLRYEEPTIKSFYSEYEMILIERLDFLFNKIAQTNQATSRQYPSLLSEEGMNRCEYHKNFPQNVYTLFHIPHDFQTIEKLRMENSGTLPSHAFVHADVYLRPCICYHVYEELQQQSLDRFTLYTSKGQCFRHEVSWKTNDFRKIEFTMREIVFVGEREQVEEFRNKLINEVWQVFENLGLKGRVVSARDPFFHYDDMKTKGAFQAMANAKYELEYVSKNGKTISIASFNNCGDMICRKYGITDPEQEYLHSGCVAFGMDRWKEAISDTYGNSEEYWPALLQVLETKF